MTINDEMPAHLWQPPSGTGPGLVLLQEIFGVSAYIRQRGADLAALGYVVLAPEIYWRLDAQQVDETREDFLERAMGLAGQLDWPTAVADGVTALAHRRGRPEVTGGVGLIGFCFGGGLAFNIAAESGPDALVSYYGSALPDLLDLADRVTAPSLHHFGLADQFLDNATVERIQAAVQGPETQVETHPGAGHAFDNPHPLFHHPEATERAWAVTREFLAERLPTS